MKKLIESFFPFLAFALLFSACIEEDFDQPPTEGTDPGLTVTTTIAELKAMHTLGSFETITEDLVIKGVVAADDASGNWYRSFVLQDETGGITILIDIAESYVFYPRGREVYVKLKGLVLSDFNDLIQLGGYIASDGSLGEIVDVTQHLVKSVFRGAPEPKVKTIPQLTVDDVNTVIQLNDVYFLDTSGTYADAINQNSVNLDLSDCLDNTILVRTSGFADFANQPVAKGGGTFIGILGIYRGDFQLLIRDLNDLDMEEERCANFDPCAGLTPTVVSGVDEDFENGSNNATVEVAGWTNFAVKGSRLWQFKEFSGNVYCQATAYNDGSPEMETWLVTPGIELTSAKTLTFESAKAFWEHDGLSVWVSTDFVCDPTKATWQPLNAVLAGQSDADHAWIPSGDIDLSGLTGQTVFIGFKYVGSNNSGLTTSYRIDNVTIE